MAKIVKKQKAKIRDVKILPEIPLHLKIIRGGSLALEASKI